MKFTQSCPTLCDPHGLYSPWNSPGQITGMGSLSLTSPGDLPNPGIEPRSPSLQADSLPAEPQGKPRDTGVGSLSLLQRIFQSQELNWGFLHCRQIFLPTELSVKPQFLSYTHPTFLLSFAALIIEQETIWSSLTIAVGFQEPHFVLFLAKVLEHIPNADIKVRIPRLIN